MYLQLLIFHNVHLEFSAIKTHGIQMSLELLSQPAIYLYCTNTYGNTIIAVCNKQYSKMVIFYEQLNLDLAH